MCAVDYNHIKSGTDTSLEHSTHLSRTKSISSRVIAFGFVEVNGIPIGMPDGEST